MSRRGVVFGALVAAAVIAVLLLRGPSTNGTSAQVAANLATTGTTEQPARTGIVSPTLPLLANPLANVLPNLFASPAEKVRSLSAFGDPFAAQLRATRSGDPLLLAHSVYMTFHCMLMPVELHGKSVRQLLTETPHDRRTGNKNTPDEALIAMTEAMQSLMPLRIRPPAEIAVEVNKLMQESPIGDAPDYVRRTELFKQQAARLTPAQRAMHSAIVERSAQECRGRLVGTDVGGEYTAALDRLVASGVVSAQLFNRTAGWQSPSVDQLNDRDFDLLQRAFAEWQPDGIARLLVGGTSVIGAVDVSWVTEANLVASLELGFNLGAMSACALGVSDCGPDSARFRSACVMFGGCDQPDLAALLRHVFERDGLDPAVIDREINRVVDAYQRRDLDALGVRRKK